MYVRRYLSEGVGDRAIAPRGEESAVMLTASMASLAGFESASVPTAASCCFLRPQKPRPVPVEV